MILTTGILGGRFARIVRRVVTDEVAQHRLTQMYLDAKQAIAAREETLKIVSHDLRNPLGAIEMTAQFLLEVPGTPEQRAKYLRNIKRTAGSTHRLVEDLLDAARVESGTLAILPRNVNVESLLDGVLEMMRPLAAESSLSLEVEIAEPLPDIHADPDRIAQVFSNLIGNAIKFTQEGGRITIRAAPTGSKVRFGVADNGPGIPPEQLARIFDRMWQARSDDSRGIGLGLTIAKAIVQAHGEQIQVESRVGQGTEFWFTTPVAKPFASSSPALAPD